MVIGLVAAPRTAAATGGPVSPAVGPVPTPTLPFLPRAFPGVSYFCIITGGAAGDGLAVHSRAGSKRVRGAMLSEPRTPNPARGTAEMIGSPVSAAQSRQPSLARSGQPQVDCAL